MHPVSSTEFLQPQWFLPLFVLLWVGVTGFLAVLGGWSGLATHLRAEQPVEGERFRFVSGSLGARFLPVSYGRCLFVAVNESGFGLSILFLFRVLGPPLFIPWREVELVEQKRFLFFQYTVVRLRNQWPTLSIRGEAGKRIHQGFARARGAGVP